MFFGLESRKAVACDERFFAVSFWMQRLVRDVPNGCPAFEVIGSMVSSLLFEITYL